MKPGPWLELVINPFMLLHCCGRLILSVLGTRTPGITFGGSSGIPLTGKNNTLPGESYMNLEENYMNTGVKFG